MLKNKDPLLAPTELLDFEVGPVASVNERLKLTRFQHLKLTHPV
ncbi:hypothetical protein PhaeoP10_03901 (plasmid) [Phaeobacter inhibens]|nr:hypothetical protein PhaeoP10_03901 [Phaeobacter inhibens]